VILNLLLIPQIGIIGAATASTVSFTTAAMLKSAQIFKIHKLHPFTGNYLKPATVSAVFAYIIYLVASPVHLIWMLVYSSFCS